MFAALHFCPAAPCTTCFIVINSLKENEDAVAKTHLCECCVLDRVSHDCLLLLYKATVLADATTQPETSKQQTTLRRTDRQTRRCKHMEGYTSRQWFPCARHVNTYTVRYGLPCARSHHTRDFLISKRFQASRTCSHGFPNRLLPFKHSAHGQPSVQHLCIDEA